MRGAGFYRKFRPFIASLAILALVSLLIFVIFFTVLEWQWVAFLSGILVASVLAMATRTAQAEWRVLRLMAQLNKIKERLAQENAERGRTAATLAMASEHHAKEHEHLTQELGAHNRTKEELRAMQERLQLMSDALSIMAFYCDEQQQCRYSNTAFRTWLHLDADQVNGRHLKELLGEDAFKSMENFVEEALRGGAVHMEWSHQFRFAQCHIEGDLIPHKNPGGQVLGFIGLLADVGARKPPEGAPVIQAARTGSAVHRAQADEMPEQALYIDSIAEQLSSWENAAVRLAEILDKDELRLYHQLILPLKPGPGHPPLHEVLIRLREEEESLTPPGAFIPVVEHFNLMPKIDRWVVKHVTDWYVKKYWGARTAPDELYSINLSGQSVSDPEFADDVSKQIESSRFPAHMLCFEITVEEAVARLDDASRLISRLKQLGCRFVLDGFGDGKVSFEHFKRLPVGFLKIDDSLVRNIIRDKVALDRVTAMQRVCNKIGVRTIAGFVENDDLLNKVKELGMDYAQGFGIDRPKPLK